MSHDVVAVAYSAGRDSTALLHATACQAAAQGLQVIGLHVHHGLSAQADHWLAHAQAQCQAWAERGLPVRLVFHRIQTRPAAGESIEAWARRERYRALRVMALEAGAQIVLLAHHRRDQAETLLLQGLRGAGVAGLAGMARSIERDGITWLRPWLTQPREFIEAYVDRHELTFVDDDSNADARFARNRLRLQVWPALTTAFAQAEHALADAATWAGEAADCLQELAQIDLERLAGPAGLQLKAWAALSLPRRMNALRAWLRAQIGESPSSSLLFRLRKELIQPGSAQWPCTVGVLLRYRGQLRFQRVEHRELDEPVLPRETHLRIQRAGQFLLPGWCGSVVAKRVKAQGIPIAWLAHLELRPREGGEQFQGEIGRPARSLKKQFQAAAVPAWEREGPLIYSGGQLLFVPGLGVDARVWALPGQPQLSLSWHTG